MTAGKADRDTQRVLTHKDSTCLTPYCHQERPDNNIIMKLHNALISSALVTAVAAEKSATNLRRLKVNHLFVSNVFMSRRSSSAGRHQSAADGGGGHISIEMI
jgi:hypothetical protein